MNLFDMTLFGIDLHVEKNVIQAITVYYKL